MRRVLFVLSCLLANVALNATHSRKMPLKLVLSGPRSAHAGDRLPLRLKFFNISTNQRLVLHRGCADVYISWSIHGSDGKGVHPHGDLIDCLDDTVPLDPGMEREWDVDPSVRFLFSGLGNYSFAATYTFKESGTFGTLKTPASVTSNTIIVSLR